MSENDGRVDPAPRWFWRLVIWFAGMASLLCLWGFLSEESGTGLLETGILVLQLVGALCGFTIVYYDTQALNEAFSWPTYRWSYLVAMFFPGPNILVVLLYLSNRRRTITSDDVPVGPRQVGKAITNPLAIFRRLVGTASVAISVFLLASVIAIPLMSILRSGNVAFGATTALPGACLLVFVGYRAYTTDSRQQAMDYFIRDLTVRFAPIAGFFAISTAVYFLMILPVALIGVPIEFVIPDFGIALALGLLAAFFILPVAVAFALPVRALPWLNAVPFIARDLGSHLSATFVPNRIHDGRSEESSDSATPLPVDGHHHTGLEIDSAVALDGFYGYSPRPVDELDLTDCPASRTWAYRLFAIPYAYAVTVLTFYFYRPERAIELASMVPGEKVIVAILSFVGVPRVAVTQFFTFVGLSPEIISLGFVGLVLPAILMIPAAWHLALQYEFVEYRLLRRLGGGNHPLLLWAMQVVMPVILGTLWFSNRRSSSPK